MIVLIDEDKDLVFRHGRDFEWPILVKSIGGYMWRIEGHDGLPVIRGRVFSGMGKGRYYVGHPEYQLRFERALGYRPYPGTLNLKLEDDGSVGAVRELRAAEGVGIDSFEIAGESFSALKCFDGRMGGERVTLLFIDITYYNERVAELISPTFLRGKLGLKDGEEATFEIDAGRSTAGP